VSWAIYRVLMALTAGTIACDANLRLNANNEQSAYFIGVGDYSVNTWHWYGRSRYHTYASMSPQLHTPAVWET